MAVGKTNEGAKSTRPKRQCAKRFESFLGVCCHTISFFNFDFDPLKVDSNSPSTNFQNLKGSKSKVCSL